MNNILISVIVPIYNVSEYLKECLDSLEKQTFKSFEVIMINDGSTDNSEQIANEYCERNDCFYLISQNNKGLSAARNVGIDKAVGKYIYFLDSDDFLRDDALKTLFEAAEQDDLDIVKFCAYTFKDHSDNYIWNTNGYKYKGVYSDVYNGQIFFLECIKNKDYFPSCCLIFTKRSLISNHSLSFFEGILNEDNLFNFELLTHAQRVKLLDEPLYYRRIRNGSIMHSEEWLDKIKSMQICAVKVDEYQNKVPNINKEICIWLIRHFFHIMLDHWNKMCTAQKYSNETLYCFNHIHILLKKYKIRISKSEHLFFVSKHLYQFYLIAKNC